MLSMLPGILRALAACPTLLFLFNGEARVDHGVIAPIQPGSAHDAFCYILNPATRFVEQLMGRGVQRLRRVEFVPEGGAMHLRG